MTFSDYTKKIAYGFGGIPSLSPQPAYLSENPGQGMGKFMGQSGEALLGEMGTTYHSSASDRSRPNNICLFLIPSSLEQHGVTDLYCSSLGDRSVNASAGKLAQFADLDGIVANHRSKNPGI